MTSLPNRIISTAPVVDHVEVAGGLYRLLLEAPEIAALASPGQFVNILTSESWSPLLRRPMSIAGVDGERLELLYKIVGPGTRAMSQWKEGDWVNLLGPLGNGWNVPATGMLILAGGGAGLAPVNYLHDELRLSARKHHLIVGARTAKEHFFCDDPSAGISLTTDDGSLGTAGTVLDAIKLLLDDGLIPREGSTLFGCGPPGMMRALAIFAGEHGMDCQLALEEMMACGIGLCQGCNVEMKLDGDVAEHSYHQRYQLACIHGPVFTAKELAAWQA